jgi:hypothetical protein
MLTLNVGAVIDLNTSALLPGPPYPRLSNVPSRPDPQVAGNILYEILFAPSGAVVNQGSADALMSGQGVLYFWVRDPRANITNSLLLGNPQLITVYPRTGLIAAHPVAPPPNNPYTFLYLGTSSGM